MVPAARVLRRLVCLVLVLAAALLVAAFGEIEALSVAVFGGVLLLGLPLALLLYLDWVAALRARRRRRVGARLLVGIASLPAFSFGLIAFVTGLTLIVWVLYNVLVERQPQFRWSPWQGFGIGPPLVVAGWIWMRRALGHEESSFEEDEVGSAAGPERGDFEADSAAPHE
ncbi:MAG TPA: hypothetical protein VF414_02635 [Thermoanaerobaculia bacterium]